MGQSNIFLSQVSHKISQGPKCTYQIWKCAMIGLCFLPLDSVDIIVAGTRDKPLRMSTWKATLFYA